MIGLERLFDEIIGSLLDRAHGCFNGAVPAHHHNGQAGMVGLNFFEDLQTVQLAALQPNIEQHQMRLARAYGFERLVA